MILGQTRCKHNRPSPSYAVHSLWRHKGDDDAMNVYCIFIGECIFIGFDCFYCKVGSTCGRSGTDSF